MRHTTHTRQGWHAVLICVALFAAREEEKKEKKATHTFSLPAKSMKESWPWNFPRALRRVICKMACEREDCSFMPVMLVDRSCNSQYCTECVSVLAESLGAVEGD